MFGGNSNWRGPIWFPINFLIIEALERYDYFYGDTFKIEYPTGSGKLLTLREVAIDLCDRLISLLLPDETGYRPCFGDATATATSPTGRTCCFSTNTSTAKPAKASARPTRPAGPRWSSGWSANVGKSSSTRSSQEVDRPGSRLLGRLPKSLPSRVKTDGIEILP